MNEHEINTFVDSLSDDEFKDMADIRSESGRIREIKPSEDELKNAKDIFVQLNKKILPLLEKSNQPLTLLCFSNSRDEFSFSKGYLYDAIHVNCYNSTLIALKALYEGTMPTSCDAHIYPGISPENGVRLYLSLTFGSNK